MFRTKERVWKWGMECEGERSGKGGSELWREGFKVGWRVKEEWLGGEEWEVAETLERERG